jgi:hypothetical protein
MYVCLSRPCVWLGLPAMAGLARRIGLRKGAEGSAVFSTGSFDDADVHPASCLKKGDCSRYAELALHWSRLLSGKICNVARHGGAKDCDVWPALGLPQMLKVGMHAIGLLSIKLDSPIANTGPQGPPILCIWLLAQTPWIRELGWCSDLASAWVQRETQHQIPISPSTTYATLSVLGLRSFAVGLWSVCGRLRLICSRRCFAVARELGSFWGSNLPDNKDLIVQTSWSLLGSLLGPC